MSNLQCQEIEAPYQLERNSQAEHFSRSIHNLLWILSTEQKRRWPEHLQELVFTYNSTPHLSTGYAHISCNILKPFPGAKSPDVDDDDWCCMATFVHMVG